MIFFGCDNLTKQSVAQVVPWEFKPAAFPSEKVRLDKIERQYFYKNPVTCWQFYGLIEGSNPNQRVSKDNPPRALFGIAADYDLAIPQSRVDEAVASLKIKPSWTERSLGGNVRLVWPFARPLTLDGYDFAVYLLDKSRSWLSLDLLPGLDAGALTDPTRLYCNGAQWTSTGAPAISERELQAFFVASGKEFRFQSADDCAIPLDVVEKALREKFSNFDWSGEFMLESQGPSFWLPGSTSPMSAICKRDGMFTFSAHATKPFYGWSDILGSEFVAEFTKTSISSATSEVFWDGKAFWQKANGRYHDCAKDELTLFFRVDCKISAKPGKGGVSQQDIALRHIQSQNRIVGAAPFVFYPSGLFNFMGQPTLNTSTVKVMPPASEPGVWGENGNFPWLSRHFDNFFEPVSQLPHFLAWFKAFYESGLTLKPMPGQNVFFMGGVATGKCVGRNVLVMIHDGSTRRAEDIKPGDLLMGDDGQPRRVLAANQGRGPMYRIKSGLGESWTCNDEHILVLTRTGTLEKKSHPQYEFMFAGCHHSRLVKGQQLEISVKDFLRLPDNQKEDWKLFTSSGWERLEVKYEFDPYIYGLWLGDGCATHGNLYTADLPIEQHWKQYFESLGLHVLTRTQGSGPCKRCAVSGKGKNPWRTFVKTHNKEKWILPGYLQGSRAQRLQLLAGLLDSDGHYNSPGGGFEITQKYKRFAEQIAFLARSLGFFVSLRLVRKGCQTGAVGTYYRMFISGDVEQIPTILKRKQARPRSQNKNVRVSGFTIEPIGEDDYFGVVLDGNRRFLLADGTVTHNTMTSHAIIGKAVGGFQDASKYLTANSDFNSELTAVPLWTVDDETVGENSRAQSNFAALWKRTAANQTMRSHKKFGIPVMVMWSGRIVATSNLDSVSSRIVGPLDNSSLDKTSLFKCAAESRIVFPNRHDLVVIIERELPHLLRWLVDWTPPDCIKRDGRYVYASFQESSLLDTAHQSSNAAPFSELLIESLENWFSANPEATEFKGSLTQIMRLLQSNPMNSEVIRTLRLQSTARYLESLQRSGILNCRVEVGNLKTRIWVFSRFGAQPASHAKAPELPASNAINIFSK